MIPVKLDDNLKQEVAEIFKSLGLSESDAISLFYEQVIQHKGLPFAVDVPNAQTEEAINDARAQKLTSLTITEMDTLFDT